MKSGVYKIENKTSGKVYIGSSIHVENRLRDHTKDLRKNAHCNQYLQSSFNKHGEVAFSFSKLIDCPEEYLDKAEQFFMDAYPKLGFPLYNILPVASVRNKEYREATSRILTEYCKAPEVRARMSAVRIGAEHSQETKDKQSASAKKRYENPEERIKTGLLSTGRIFSDETKAKMSAAKSTPEAKARISFVNKNRIPSKETRAKMSASAKARAALPEEKLRKSLMAKAVHTGSKRSNETKRKMSESGKKAYAEGRRGLSSICLPGHLVSDETKQKLSKAAKNRKAKR